MFEAASNCQPSCSCATIEISGDFRKQKAMLILGLSLIVHRIKKYFFWRFGISVACSRSSKITSCLLEVAWA